MTPVSTDQEAATLQEVAEFHAKVARLIQAQALHARAGHAEVFKYDPNQLRHPEGEHEGGQFATEAGTLVAPDPKLVKEATEGIAAIETLLPEAVKTADYTNLEEDIKPTWKDLNEQDQHSVYKNWEEGQQVDTPELREASEHEVQQNNQQILKDAKDQFLKSLSQHEEFGVDNQPALDLSTEEEQKDPNHWVNAAFGTKTQFNLKRTIDPESVDYGEGHHIEVDLKLVHSGIAPLNLDKLRYTNGEPLTEGDRKIAETTWYNAYRNEYTYAVENARSSSAYVARESAAIDAELADRWAHTSESEKNALVADYDTMGWVPALQYQPKVVPGSPKQWVTGITEEEQEAGGSENRARTNIVATRLVELRTEELRKARHTDDAVQRPYEKTYTIKKGLPSFNGLENYLILNGQGEIIGSSNTLAQATANAEEWKKSVNAPPVPIETSTLIHSVWSNWKSSSSSPLSNALQLASVEELGGHHRLTKTEIEDAQDAALSEYGGMAPLKAYVRAQWEVSQYLLSKSGQDQVEVYRALMLSESELKKTPHVYVNQKGQETAPTNIKVGYSDDFTHDLGDVNKPLRKATFDFGGNPYVAYVGNTQTPEEAIEQKVKDLVAWDGGFEEKLPKITLQRAGAQSTTGTREVANDWQGVGHLPPNSTRVVLRLATPATSVLSLPVFGQNMINEHETVLVGTNDHWAWDAWQRHAPTFTDQPLVATARKADTQALVIDLQALDRGQPHWLSQTDFEALHLRAFKFDPNQLRHPEGTSEGGQFATEAGTTVVPDPKLLAQAQVGIAAVEKLIPDAVQTAHYGQKAQQNLQWKDLDQDTQQKVFLNFAELPANQKDELKEVGENWNALSDQQKMEMALFQHKYDGVDLPPIPVEPGLPTQWETGMEDATAEESTVRHTEDYERTHAVANRLTELRTDELRKERGLYPSSRTYVIKETAGDAEARFSIHFADTSDRATFKMFKTKDEAEAFAKQMPAFEPQPKVLTPPTNQLIRDVWTAWKGSSSGPLANALQYAAAQEFHGVHRLTPHELDQATEEAEQYGGIETLRAYVRAQWEVSQTVLAKSHTLEIPVYRALMLEEARVDQTAQRYLDPTGKELKPEHVQATPLSKEYTIETSSGMFAAYDERKHLVGMASTKEKLEKEMQAWQKAKSLVDLSFDFAGEHFLVGQDAGETPEAAMARRIDNWNVGGRLLMQLPDLQLQRAGAQSTTSTQVVANSWGGVGGTMPAHPRRVVLRIAAPPTSVLSLPVFGQNLQSEHETVLIGSQDRWAWDAWKDHAPSFTDVPLEHRVMAHKTDTVPLVIDLQAEDRGKPHWLSQTTFPMVITPPTHADVLKGSKAIILKQEPVFTFLFGDRVFTELHAGAKAVGVGGLTQKADRTYVRDAQGRFAEADVPRVFNTPADIEPVKGWPGEPEQHQWVKEPGHLVMGLPLSRATLPDTLYHVTTNASAVKTSGVLLGQRGDQGLGGGQAEGVSFTTSQDDALNIQRELQRSVANARGETTLDDLDRFAREDEQSAGLPAHTLDDAVEFAKTNAAIGMSQLDKTFVWDKNLPEDQRGWVGPPPPPEEREQTRRSLMMDAHRAYLQIRGHHDTPQLQNPILFGRQAQLAQITPEEIQILQVPSAHIPESALVTTGSDAFLHEVRAYADVPYSRAARKCSTLEEVFTWRKAPVRKYEVVFKYAKNQARDPKGTSTGGRFARGSSAGASAASFMGPNPGISGPIIGYDYQPRLPQGTGFANPVRVVGEPPVGKPGFTNTPVLERVEPKPPKMTPLLTGKIIESEPAGGGVNTSFTVTMEDGKLALYKPENGEAWSGGFANSDISRFIKNRKLSLAEREAMAYEIDQALGIGLVPETVLRPHVPVDTDSGGGSSSSGGGYDSDELQRMYDDYREAHQDQAYEAAGEKMQSMYQREREEHAGDIANRVEEITDIWNDLVADIPDHPEYGSPSVVAAHPALPLGTQVPFERKDPHQVLDPLEVLDEAKVYEMGRALNTRNKAAVEAVLRQKLKDGYNELGDVDESRAKSHLTYTGFQQAHEDTEMRAIDSYFQSFDQWKQDNNYSSGGGNSGSGDVKNALAPHPEGGSLQRYVEPDDPARGVNNGPKYAVLDYVLGSMDRHSGNVFRGRAIDNGYSLPGSPSADDFTFRSSKVKDWLDNGGKIDDPLRESLHTALTTTNWNAYVAKHPAMTDAEKNALLGRVSNMTQALTTSEGLRNLWYSRDLMS